MTRNFVYVAIDKETGSIVLGARGQAGFRDTGSLNKSIAQRYRGSSKYKEVGVKASDYYTIKCVDMDKVDAEEAC